MNRTERLAIAAQLRAQLAQADCDANRTARRVAAAGDVAVRRERDPYRRAVLAVDILELRKAIGLRSRATVTGALPVSAASPRPVSHRRDAAQSPIERNGP